MGVAEHQCPDAALGFHFKRKSRRQLEHIVTIIVIRECVAPLAIPNRPLRAPLVPDNILDKNILVGLQSYLPQKIFCLPVIC
jgi:hypothetical protein